MKGIDYKKAREFGTLELLAKQVVEGFITGLHKSPFHGFSVEFAEHRLYNKGESTKHIDWKLFARSDKLFVKKYEEETNLRCQIVIDTSSSMYFPSNQSLNKLSFSIDAAAALIYIMRKQRDAVGLSLFDADFKFHSKAKSSVANQRFLFAELEKYLFKYDVAQKSSTQLIDALHHVAERAQRRSMIVIFSDLLGFTDKEALYGALKHLKHNKHEVVIFHVLHNDFENKLSYENRPYTFIDMESGEEVKLNPTQIKEKYNSLVADNQLELKLKCGQYHIDFVSANIQDGFQQVLMQYLIKDKK